MEEYTRTERRIDLLCLVAFPMGFIILAVNAYLGHSEAFFGDTYVAATQVVSALVVMVLPIMRLTKKFRVPYWFVFMITSVPYLHAVSLYFGFYNNLSYWDFISHSYSSAVVTMVAFLAMLIISHYTTRIRLGIKGILAGTLLMGHGFGNIWEVWEWSVDCFFEDSYMSYSIMDTVKDICLGDFVGVTLMTMVAFVIMLHKDYDKIVDGMNLGKFMDDMGRRWDRKCVNRDPGAENDR